MNNNEIKDKNNNVVKFPVYIKGKDKDHRMIFTQRMNDLLAKARKEINNYNIGIEKNVVNNLYFFSQEYIDILAEDMEMIKSVVNLIDNDGINNNDPSFRMDIEDSLDMYLRTFRIHFLEGCEEYNKRELKRLEARQKELEDTVDDTPITNLIKGDSDKK